MNALLLKLLAQRIGLACLSLLAVSVVVFAITGVLPGDAAQEQLGQEATPESLAALRAQMGLDVPAHQRYLRLAGRPGARRPRHFVGDPAAGGRAHRQPAAQLAAAGGRDRVVLGADRAHAGHLGGRVARLVVRPRRLHRRGGGGLGARVPGGHAGRADLRGAAALAAGAVLPEQHRIARPVAARLRHAGADARPASSWRR